MIAVDTSTIIEYLAGGRGQDIDAAEVALEQKQAVLAPVVLCELLSAPRLPSGLSSLLKELPVLEVVDGFWERTGELRSKIIRQGRRARLADALIAQTCIDHNVPLITRDVDFRHFVRYGGLRIVPK
jgi:predicted nucleic acid-binding protein